MHNLLPITKRQRLILTGLTTLAVLFGLVVRFNGLGEWPLSVDEYYLTKSVLSILNTGLPGYECGGFYTRGLLQQYLSSTAVASIDNTELAMRIYPVITSLIVLWAAFLLGQRAGGLTVGCIVLALLSLSLWEIEFSRFARMYMPFQALTVIQVYLFLKIILDGATDNFKWMLLTGLLGIITYEGAIFLAILPVIAIMRRRSLRTPQLISLTASLIILAIGYILIKLQSMGVEQTPLPDEVIAGLASSAGGHLIAYPDLGHLSALAEHPVWLAALFLVIFIAGIYSLKHIRSLPVIGIAFWIITLASFSISLVGLGIVIYLCMTLIFMNRDERLAARRFLYFVVVPATIFITVFWVAFLSLNIDMAPRDILVTLIKYPNVIGPMKYSILTVVPVLMLVLLVPITAYAALLFIRRDYNDDTFVLLGGLAIMFFAGVALASPQPFETRYSFFIYPLVICLFSISVVNLSGLFIKSRRMAILAPLLASGAFTSTEDFDLHHYLNINTAEINYRINYPTELQEHYKSRKDNRTSAYFINARVKEIDTVVIAESAPDFYLDTTDYRYKELWNSKFRHHIICGLEHDKWSNAPILYKTEQIDELINNAAGDVWLIQSTDIHDEWQQKMKKYEVYMAPDTVTHVLQIPPGG